MIVDNIMSFCEVDDCFNQAYWVYYVVNYETLCEEHKNRHLGDAEKFMIIDKLTKDTSIKFIYARFKVIKTSIKKISQFSLAQNPNDQLKKSISDWRDIIIDAARSLKSICRNANEYEVKIILSKINYFKIDYTVVKQLKTIEDCEKLYFMQKFQFSDPAPVLKTVEISYESQQSIRKASQSLFKLEQNLSTSTGYKLFISEFILIDNNGKKFLMKSCLHDKNESIKFIEDEIRFLESTNNNEMFLKFTNSEVLDLGNSSETIYYTEYKGMSLNQKLKLFSYNDAKVIEFFKFIKNSLNQLKNQSIKIDYIDPTMINMDKSFIFARLKTENLDRNPEFEAPEFIQSELKPYFCACLIAFRILGITLGKWKELNKKKVNRIKMENLKNFLEHLILAPNEFSLSRFEMLLK